jgi:Coenzyme PQQ synthesis protein D (PqqD)
MTQLQTRLSADLSAEAVIVATEGQISSDLAGESVILNLQSGVYYGLNEVGAHIWSVLQQPTTFPEIRSTVLEAYDVDPEVCDRDILSLLQDLQTVGLVEIRHGAA